MKKIMIFVPFMTGYGGTETVIENLFDEYNKTLPNDRYQLSLSSIGGTIDTGWLSKIKNKTVLQLSRNKKIRKIEYLISLFFILNHQIRKERPDVVISNSYIMWFCLTVLKRIFGYHYQVMAWYHFSLDSHQVPEMFLKAADGYLVISTGIAHQLEQRGIPQSKINVIYNPIVKTDHVVPRSAPDEPTHFLYVGRIMMNGQKNLHELFDGLSQTHGKWQLDVYGMGDVAEAQEYVQKLGISDRIHFHGFADDLWHEVKKCDALVLTSTFEGLPMVLNEAIANGIPVISSNCDTGPDDIVNSDNGYLYQSGDSQQLAHVLQKFIDRQVDFNDPQKIKNSINQFYSANYFEVFMNAIDQYME
ncbi:glycosyltransferase [Fructilactobacillus hinvesii]|uniref:Glycosyltransferase n=1 Tax=Fructilactobacillus hinvesii TaxID=2940300 RepID=A0ABY5BUB9_9LACO|nr:glycosyltransferase [Fructilactobacillus hinvesii]USS88038.1 glycosyltransferase [Fructilactobacillus hinvesii]